MATNNAINLQADGVVSYDGAGVFTGSVLTQFSPLIGGAANAITSLGPLTNGQLVIGQTGLIPVASTLTAGTGIAITNASGSITIAASGAPALLPWVDVITPIQTIVVNTGYVADNAGAPVTFLLPITAAFGTVFTVMGGVSGSGWVISQNAGQNLQVGSVSSTVGAIGSVASTNQYDSASFVCVVADLTWVMQDSVGNLTIV